MNIIKYTYKVNINNYIDFKIKYKKKKPYVLK